MANAEKYDEKQIKSLVSLAASGDIEAFESLMSIYNGLMKKICFGRNVSGLELDDLMQIGWMTMLEAAGKYDSAANTSFSAFLTTCVNNALNDEYRKSSNEGNSALNTSVRLTDSESENTGNSGETGILTVPEEEVADVTESAEDDALKTVFSENLQSEIEAALTPQEYRIIELMFERELSYKDIASELGLSVKQVDNTWYKIKKRLRKLLLNKKDELLS